MTNQFKLAGRMLIIITSALILFHISNLFGLIPQNVVWTGRITSERTKLIFAIISILLNLIILLCAVVRMNYIKNENLQLIVKKSLPFVFWWLVGNTVANFFSKSLFEVLVFTPVLIILTACFYSIKQEKVA